MKQEDKELLLKDLCARLPYGVKVQYRNEIFCVEHVSPMCEEVKLDTCETWTVDLSDVKPYLFPVSSMTEELMEEFARVIVKCGTIGSSQLTHMSVEDWLNKNHFDYRGLIPMGLALDATGLNIY
jgi:hypothetical protein